MSPAELDEQKEIQFYAAGVAAWYNSALERDRSIFTLSAGGIGLLLTLLTTVGVASTWLLILYIGSIVSFLISLGAILFILSYNKTHIEQVLSKAEPASGRVLGVLDVVAVVAFAVGAALAGSVAVSVAVNSYIQKEKETNMADKSSGQTNTKVPVQESFKGVQNLQSGATFGKSFNGVGNLQPQPAAPAPIAAPVAQAPSSAPATQAGDSTSNAGK